MKMRWLQGPLTLRETSKTSEFQIDGNKDIFDHFPEI